MALDGIVVNNIVCELREKLIGGKIDKIFQPEKDEIVLSIRSQNDTYKLLLTANPNYPRIHITNLVKDNPQSPPMFCMLLRKHITNGRIVDIVQPELERVIELHIHAPNQIGDTVLNKLIIEMMGKHSNIIFVDQNNKILDAIKHITHEISRIREVLPGGEYFLPPTEKINPLDETFEGFCKTFKDIAPDLLPKRFINRYIGFSTLISNEILYRYSLRNEFAEEVDIALLWEHFSRLIKDINESKFSPVLYMESDDKPFDFSSFDIFQYHNYKQIQCNSISETIESFYQERDKKDRLKQKSEDIKKHIQILLGRSIRKHEHLEEKIVDSRDKEKYKIWGDLILSNIHSLSKGDTTFTTINYYSPQMDEITITLDEQLTPPQNAQKFYKMYNKMKNTEITSMKLLEEIKTEINYLEGILDSISNCGDEADIDQIKQELSTQGYIRSVKTKKKANVQSQPLHYVSSDSFHIYVGKNNFQNDELTLKFAQKTDTWFHTKAIHGSHVIVKNEGQPLPDTTLFEAATLAAYYSKGRGSSKVEVDYTVVKNVKKPSGAKPGMVIYVEYKTIIVEPDEKLINSLKR